MRRIAIGAAAVLAAGAFYLLLVDTVSLPELYVLAAVAVLSALAFEASRGEVLGEVAIRPAWLLRAWRPIASVPRHVALVSREAIVQLFTRKRVRGEFRAVAFSGGETSEDRGRSALTESLGSFAPNTIVIGVDPDRNLLLVHQLRRDGGRSELDVLRLG